MGNYIVQSDLEAPVGGLSILTELADLDDDGVIDTTVIDQAIEEAESIVDSYVGQRHSVPVTTTPTPTVLKMWSAHIARWILGSGRALGNLELYQYNYEQTMTMLNRVARGSIQINVATKPTGSSRVTMGGIIEQDDYEDGGPYWDDDWRDEGGDVESEW